MIPYIGGKSFLASWVISNFPEDYQERVYIEVFGGGGWVLFKKEQSHLEVYNDLNSNLVNLFKVIRDNFSEFQYKAEWTLHSREMYNEARMRLKEDKFLNEIEKAMHYSIDRCQSFAGSGGWAYQVTADRVTNGKWLPFLRRLSLINARLKHVQIGHNDFETIIKKYDDKNAIFYLDPPYVDAEFYYDNKEVNFRKDDHIRLNKLVKKIKGKCIISYYDNPLVRELYKGFNIITKESVKHCQKIHKNSTKNREKKRVIELLIKNY